MHLLQVLVVSCEASPSNLNLEPSKSKKTACRVCPIWDIPQTSPQTPDLPTDVWRESAAKAQTAPSDREKPAKKRTISPQGQAKIFRRDNLASIPLLFQ